MQPMTCSSGCPVLGLMPKCKAYSIQHVPCLQASSALLTPSKAHISESIWLITTTFTGESYRPSTCITTLYVTITPQTCMQPSCTSSMVVSTARVTTFLSGETYMPEEGGLALRLQRGAACSPGVIASTARIIRPSLAGLKKKRSCGTCS